jgi:hypothetical protein
MDELAFYPATKLAQMIRSGEASSKDIEDRPPIDFAARLADIRGGFEPSPCF